MPANTEGLNILRKSDSGDTIRQLLKIGGFEVMLVNLLESDTIWIAPAEDKELIEFYFILSGGVELLDEGDSITLGEGDGFHVSALRHDLRMRAPEYAQLLYVSNLPVYDNVRDYSETLKATLETIDKKDHITREHSLNVHRLTLALFERLKNREYKLDDVTAAALFHDIGKRDIPDEILNKTGRLTADEYEVMKTHSMLSYDILLPMYGLQIALIARSHHERLDGSGYPDGLKGDEISFPARVIAVCDAFEAMTHKRPYNKTKTPTEALNELKDLSDKYDIQIVSALERIIAEGAELI